jgi:Carboxylesterase.
LFNAGLFHRVISESGTALGLWAVAPNGSSVHHTKKLASLLDCPAQPSKALLSCLKRLEASKIINTDTAFMVSWFSMSLKYYLCST